MTLHGALYGYAICALQGTNPDNVIEFRRKSINIREIVLKLFYLKIDIKLSLLNKKDIENTGKLISFDEAIKRCQNTKYMNMTVLSKILKLTDSQKQSIRKLNKIFRNNFIHYLPKFWIIEIDGLPQIAIDIIDVIHFLARKSGNYVMFSEGDAEKIDDIVYKSKKILKDIYE